MPTTRSQASKRGFLTEAEALDIARKAKTVAVLGIKTEQKANQPAFYVPAYLASQGKNVIPIPVYFPDVKEILGRPVKRRVSEVEEPIDILNIFRKPSDLMGHLDDILSAPHRPACVWLQTGITHPQFEACMADAGISVVADRCLMVDLMNA
eukprot:CAMPEP_0202362726 /NCGR_PEP_ID=MMETSP1126-20121109/14800_1 /ASSEMBLY_ACC=CAM_ASM_000457 /TAXON_ID=3047 /ORGANISM="Dunaliella tertiolecta, Strain CCMP1320" /LENGTH=151 /DNA_ID=CAMNT_0048956989 /DNA_START=114 /DNA_END=572 /DNA_ORIENTATION=+